MVQSPPGRWIIWKKEMSKKSITQCYEKFSSVLEKARKSSWNIVAFLGGVAWLLYQQMFIWGFALFVIYEGWAHECISSKSVEYYEKAFDRLDKTGKHTWNWAAFFGGITWMLYRKMYFNALLFSILYLVTDLFLCAHAVPKMGGELGIVAACICIFELIVPRVCLMSLGMCTAHICDKFIHYFKNGMISFEGWEILIVVAVIAFIISRLYLGYFGNAIYYRIVKKRIKKGYHQVDDAHPTSIISCFGSMFFLLGLVTLSSSKKYTVDKGSIRTYLNPKRKTSPPC